LRQIGLIADIRGMSRLDGRGVKGEREKLVPIIEQSLDCL
jgi:hypothetical protein